MSMRNESAPLRRAQVVLGLAVGAAVVITLGLLLREQGPGNMGNGMLAGGALGLLGFGLAAWRVWYRPDRASSLDRSIIGSGDERDDAILTRALAVAGVTALPLTGLAVVAIALSISTDAVLAVLIFAQAAVLVAAYLFQVRRG